MQEFLAFVEKWFNIFLEMFQKLYHTAKDKDLLPTEEEA